MGQLLVHCGFVRAAEVRRALAMQADRHEPLGEILVSMGAIERAHLHLALAIQEDLSDPEQARRLASTVPLKLGEILLAAGKLTQERLDAALEEQARTGYKLGEILLRRGWLDHTTLERALMLQRPETGGHRRLRLGEVLVAAGEITRDQLHDALARQYGSGRFLGSELIEAGHITHAQLHKGLQLQRMLLAAALTVAVAGATLALPSSAEASGVGSRVAVTATVLPHTSVRLLETPESITLSALDVARGYVDVMQPSRLELRTNTPAGCVIAVEGSADFMRATEVRSAGTTTMIEGEGGFITLPAQGPGMQVVPVELHFRIYLAEGARPGAYAWPLRLSVIPL